MLLEIANMKKNYGNIIALNDVSLTLGTGVYGLLGPNGAGKSTLIQIVTGNLQATSGEIFYNGINIKNCEKEYKKRLGYVPQNQGIYENFSSKKFLEYMAVLKAIAKKEIGSEVQRVLEIVGLLEVQHRKLGSFSGGMRQRILIAQALLGNPELIILDEPTAGLDPKERIKIRNFISRIAENKIILIATHVVSDVESIAKEIVLLGQGVIQKKGTPKDLCEWLNDGVLECIVNSEQFEQLEQEAVISNLQEMPDGNLQVRLLGDGRKRKQLEERQIQVVSRFPNLQEVYLAVFTEKSK